MELRRIVMSTKRRGYGRRAIKEILKLAFYELGAQRVWLDTYPNNKVGIHLYKTLGFMEEGHLRRNDFHNGKYHDQVIFGMFKEEYDEIY